MINTILSGIGDFMSLTNSQYDSIMRIYSNIQTRNRHIHEARVEEVYRACPRVFEIENQIIDLSATSAPLIISGSSGEMSSYRQRLDELESERRRIIELAGYPEDYLEPIYDCRLCLDTGFADGRQCSCFKKKVTDMFYMRSNLKNIVDCENFDTFSFEWYSKSDIDEVSGISSFDNMQTAFNTCRLFVERFDEEFHNLLIYGATGVGKTFLSNCIAKSLLDSSHSVIYLTAIEFFDAFSTFNYNDDVTGTEAESILGCDLLIIDDLGTELSNTFTNSKLFYCVNERMLKRRATIISTNLSPRELSRIYSERIMSRITSAYTILKIFGKDIRLQKMQRRNI